MGRRAVDPDAAQNVEPPKKRNRPAAEICDMIATVDLDKPLPSGEILVDVCQKQWKIGKPIGVGSFGEIYLASDDVGKEVTVQNSRYVIKIEPHSNGPLFVEIHCLIRSARHSKIKKWQQEKKMKLLGMPHYIANGSHLLGDTRYRFLVLPRYDCDIEKIVLSSNRRLMAVKNILILASQIIDVLEYLHAHGYTHSDIKSSNLMVGFDGSKFRDNKNKSFDSDVAIKKLTTNKSIKSNVKYASYYYDEDFVLHNYLSSNSNSDYETDVDDNSVVMERPVKSPKFLRLCKNTRGEKKSSAQKNIRMKRLFNLRKLRSDVNYEDLNSSICSYDSYQELLENNNNKGNCDQSNESEDNEVDHFKEAIQTQSSGHIYLLDFGLASKFVNSDGSHKEYAMDQRKAHDGTLEYSSRDSHVGAHSRRSDLENLGYNILDWLTGNLPWKNKEMLADPDIVHALKKNYMNDLKEFMKTCFKTQSYPKFIEQYFQYLEKLEFEEKPDYKYCKDIFINEFIDRGYGNAEDMILNFKNHESTPRKKINYSKKHSNSVCKNTPPDFLKRNAICKVYGRENQHNTSWESDIRLNMIREGLSNDGIRKPCVSRNFFVSDADLISKLRQTLLLNHDKTSKKFSPKNLRSTKRIIKKKKGGRNLKSNIGKFGNFLGSDKQYTWAEILAGNPESIIRKSDKDKNCDATENHKNGQSKNPRSRKVSSASEASSYNVDVNASPNLLKNDFLSRLNPTYAMKEVVANYKRKTQGKSTVKSDNFEGCANEHGYTYAMIKVIRNMEKRLAKERLLEEKEMKKNKTLKPDVNAKSSKSVKIQSDALKVNNKKQTTPRKVICVRSKQCNKKKLAQGRAKPAKNVEINNPDAESTPTRTLRCRTSVNVVKSIENQQIKPKVRKCSESNSSTASQSSVSQGDSVTGDVKRRTSKRSTAGKQTKTTKIVEDNDSPTTMMSTRSRARL